MKYTPFMALAVVGCGYMWGQTAGTGPDRAPVILDSPASGLERWLAPYHAKSVPAVNFHNSNRIYELLRAGNLYLSLSDAIALAIENNLDVQIARFQLPSAELDLLRAKGGGTLRGISGAAAEVPVGVGGPASPLLNIAASSSTPSTTVPTNVTELSALLPSATTISVLPGGGSSPGPFSAGPPLPLFDPSLVGNVNWEHQTTPETSTVTTGTNTLVTSGTTGSLNLEQAFSPGTSYSLGFTSSSQTVNSIRSNYNPYSTGTLGLTVTQPLLRGFGMAVNRRFIRIAKNNTRITNMVFRQQLIQTVFGISRLYYDLVALHEDLLVKQDTLAAARSLFENTRASVEEGTLAPVEQTRAEAQVAGAEQDLVNSQGLLDEEELILKNVLTRNAAGDPAIAAARIVPTETLEVPAQEPVVLNDEMVSQAFANRPDLEQAGLQVTNAEISLKGTRNALLPQIDLVGIAQNSGLAGQANPLASTASAGAGSSLVSSGSDIPGIGGYGSLLGQLFTRNFPTYGIGLNVNLPLRNRIAQSDVVRDELLFRETQTRRQELENQAKLEVADALIGLRRARAAYEAAVKTRLLQQQSLEIEQLRLENGVSTPFFVIQYQSYLAQARSTEVVARGNYFKARAALERATGSTLENHNIDVSEAYKGQISRAPQGH